MHGELRNATFHIRGESDVTGSIERNTGEINREGNTLLAEVNNNQVITSGENRGTRLIPTCYQYNKRLQSNRVVVFEFIIAVTEHVDEQQTAGF